MFYFLHFIGEFLIKGYSTGGYVLFCANPLILAIDIPGMEATGLPCVLYFLDQRRNMLKLIILSFIHSFGSLLYDR
jgi:hypothetical protein